MNVGTEADASPPVDELVGGNETILVVDDEDAVVNVARRMLERAGYTVLTASSASEARTLVSEGGERLDLLLTDVVMPSCTGPRLYRDLQERLPELRVVFISGYEVEYLAGSQHELRADSLLSKPFTPSELTQRVRDALDRAA